MADGRFDEWFGWRVNVQLAEEESHRFSCTLVSADGRGIVVSSHRKEADKTHHRFHPWHNIGWL